MVRCTTGQAAFARGWGKFVLPIPKTCDLTSANWTCADPKPNAFPRARKPLSQIKSARLTATVRHKSIVGHHVSVAALTLRGRQGDIQGGTDWEGMLGSTLQKHQHKPQVAWKGFAVGNLQTRQGSNWKYIQGDRRGIHKKQRTETNK